MTSRAHELFRQIVEADDPAQVLKDMVASHRTETEFLEFKGAGKIQPKQVKEFWSQALSGFANTEGGVLVWGIRAARIEHPDDPSRKIDTATKLDLVTTPATFAQLLKDVLLEACVEPVQGLELIEIDAGEDDGSGFIVCLIPEGNHKPYRAGLDSAKQYYQRIGDNFVVIPHSLLRSLFFPQRVAQLEVRMTSEVPPERNGRLHFDGFVGNAGNATARELFGVIEVNTKMEFRPTKKFAVDYRKNYLIATVEAFQSVHPGAELHLFSCSIALDTVGANDNFIFAMQLHSQHQPQQIVEIAFEQDEALQGASKKAIADITTN